MLSGRTTTTVSAPAHGPLDYNSLRPSFAQIAPLFGLTLLALLPIALGGLLVYWSWPEYGEVGGLRALGLGLGALLALAGVRFFWPLSTTIPDAIKQYHAMVYAWHDAELRKYEAGDGLITAHQMSEWSYTEQDMRHVALAALWLILEQPRSLSIERLTKGPLHLTIGHRAFKLMDMTQDGAAGFLNLCASAGVINGRGPRTAGTIAIMDSRAAALKILAEASRNPAMIGSEDVA
jgi:hypothetical protein